MLRDHKCALITGAGSGIGRALAVEAVQRGMVVALCGRRETALEATAALLGRESQHLIIPADITDPLGRRRIVEIITTNGRHSTYSSITPELSRAALSRNSTMTQ